MLGSVWVAPSNIRADDGSAVDATLSGQRALGALGPDACAGASPEDTPRVVAALEQFCDGDAFDALCGEVRHWDSNLSPHDEVFETFKRPNGETTPRYYGTFWHFFSDRGKPNPDYLAYLDRKERETYARVQVVDGSGKRTELTPEILDGFAGGYRSTIDAELAGLAAIAPGDLKDIRTRVSLSHVSTHARLQRKFASSGTLFHEFVAGADACNYTGDSEEDRGLPPELRNYPEQGSYAAGDFDENVALCPGTVADLGATFYAGPDQPFPSGAARLGLAAIIGHEIGHTIDPGKFPCVDGKGPWCGFEACIRAKDFRDYASNTMTREKYQRWIKELFADHFGAEALAAELKTEGRALTIKKKLRVLLSNFRAICTDDVEEGRIRIQEYSANPQLRSALGCRSPSPPAAKGPVCAPGKGEARG